MATLLTIVQQRTVSAANREQRARDGELAMREYEAEKLAVHANMARLRALRLAQETGAKQHKAKEPAAQDRWRGSRSTAR
jgi:hypothetical protein